MNSPEYNQNDSVERQFLDRASDIESTLREMSDVIQKLERTDNLENSNSDFDIEYYREEVAKYWKNWGDVANGFKNLEYSERQKHFQTIQSQDAIIHELYKLRDILKSL
jgi:hypothetical protein